MPHTDIPSDIHTCDRMPDKFPVLAPATMANSSWFFSPLTNEAFSVPQFGD